MPDDDLVLIKNIQRAVGINVSDATQVSEALAKVRALLEAKEPARAERGGRNRMYLGGSDRSGDDAA